MSVIKKLKIVSKDKLYSQMFEFYKEKKVFAQSIQDKVLFRLMLKLTQTLRNRDGFAFIDAQWEKVVF